MKVSDALIEALKLISERGNWIQGWYAATSDGKQAQAHTREACKFCSKGAISHVVAMFNVGSDIHAQMEIALKKTMAGSVLFYNDGKTHSEVIAAWKAGIQRQIAKELKDAALGFSEGS